MNKWLRRNDRSKNLVEFKVGDVTYAIEILLVREVINPLPIVPLPHAPPTIVGLAHYRQDVLPVIDLRQRFGLEQTPQTKKTRWLVLMQKEKPVAFIVDAVTDVFGVTSDSQREVPQLGYGDQTRGIKHAYVKHEKLVFLIDADQITDALALLEKDHLLLMEGTNAI